MYNLEYDRKLIDYLPSVVGETDEFKALMQSEDVDVETAWGNINKIKDEGFIISAESIGLERLEKICELSGEGLSIAERRSQIILKLMGDTPYTMCTLYDKLYAAYGTHFLMEYGNDPYTLVVKVGSEYENMFPALKKLLYKITPANIGLVLTILYNTHNGLSRLTHQQMSLYSHAMLRADLSLTKG